MLQLGEQTAGHGAITPLSVCTSVSLLHMRLLTSLKDTAAILAFYSQVLILF